MDGGRVYLVARQDSSQETMLNHAYKHELS